MLINMHGNYWVNTAHIVSVIQQDHRVILTMIDGSKEPSYYMNPQVASKVLDNLQREMLAVIPAHPGYAVVNLVCAEPRYLLDPIVGWRLHGTECTPLTIGGLWSEEDECYVLTPLGRVESPNESFDTVQDFVKAHHGFYSGEGA